MTLTVFYFLRLQVFGCRRSCTQIWGIRWMKTRQQNDSRATLVTSRTCRSALSAIIKRTNADSHGSSSANSATLVSCTSIIYRGTSGGCIVTAFGDRMDARRVLSHGSSFAKLNALSMAFKENYIFDLKERFLDTHKTEKT